MKHLPIHKKYQVNNFDNVNAFLILRMQNEACIYFESSLFLLITILTFCMMGNFSCFCCRLLTFFKIKRISNGLDPDQDRRSVGPDLDPNCLQMLSADAKSRRKQGKSYSNQMSQHIRSWYLSGIVWVSLSKCAYSPEPSLFAFTKCDGSAVAQCSTRDRGAVDSNLNGVTALWSLSKIYLS